MMVPHPFEQGGLRARLDDGQRRCWCGLPEGVHPVPVPSPPPPLPTTC
jgi:hypothetical protein